MSRLKNIFWGGGCGGGIINEEFEFFLNSDTANKVAKAHGRPFVVFVESLLYCFVIK